MVSITSFCVRPVGRGSGLARLMLNSTSMTLLDGPDELCVVVLFMCCFLALGAWIAALTVDAIARDCESCWKDTEVADAWARELGWVGADLEPNPTEAKVRL